jgi:hypothetical protein
MNRVDRLSTFTRFPILMTLVAVCAVSSVRMAISISVTVKDVFLFDFLKSMT